MMNIIIVVLSCLVIYQLVQVNGKTCPKSIKPMTDLDFKKTMGVWYIVAHSKNNITLPLKCLRNEYFVINDIKYRVETTAVAIKGNRPFTITTYVRLVGDPRNGRFLGRTVYGKQEDIYYANLITDYDTIHFVYGCNVEDKTVHSWMMAKERQPSEEFFEAMNNFLKEHNLDPADYERVNQENCPE